MPNEPENTTPTKAPTPSPSVSSDPAVAWPQLPTETDIYILPDGRVVVADLPAELANLVASLGAIEPSAIETND